MTNFLLIIIILELAFFASLFYWAIILPLQEKKELERINTMRKIWENETK